MIRILFSLLLTTSLLSANHAFANSADTLRAGYRDSIKFVLKNIATIKDSQVIEYCLPTTTAESHIYFSLDYEKEFSPGFRALQQKMIRYSITGNTKLLKKYLYLSEYVDGYFVDDYVAAVEKIARANIVSYCNVLKDCDPQKIKNLVEINAEYCR
ncbi:MAG: hypothetical protein WDO15_15800 [Bacteroidota bacterium]